MVGYVQTSIGTGITVPINTQGLMVIEYLESTFKKLASYPYSHNFFFFFYKKLIIEKNLHCNTQHWYLVGLILATLALCTQLSS